MIKILFAVSCMIAVFHSRVAQADVLQITGSYIGTVEDRLERIAAKAMSTIREIKERPVQRRVKKERSPEIILKRGSIYFDKKTLLLGTPLDAWKKTIPGNPRCYGGGISLCVWDDLGLEIGTDRKTSDLVTFFNIYLKFSEFEKNPSNLVFMEGGVEKKIEDWFPRRTFPGYLELDGFGIDSQTVFRELRAGVKGGKTLHCGLRDCSHPSGAFGEQARVDLTLDGSDQNDVVRKFSISTIE